MACINHSLKEYKELHKYSELTEAALDKLIRKYEALNNPGDMPTIDWVLGYKKSPSFSSTIDMQVSNVKDLANYLMLPPATDHEQEVDNVYNALSEQDADALRDREATIDLANLVYKELNNKGRPVRLSRRKSLEMLRILGFEERDTGAMDAIGKALSILPDELLSNVTLAKGLYSAFSSYGVDIPSIRKIESDPAIKAQVVRALKPYLTQQEAEMIMKEQGLPDFFVDLIDSVRVLTQLYDQFQLGTLTISHEDLDDDSKIVYVLSHESTHLVDKLLYAENDRGRPNELALARDFLHELINDPDSIGASPELKSAIAELFKFYELTATYEPTNKGELFANFSAAIFAKYRHGMPYTKGPGGYTPILYYILETFDSELNQLFDKYLGVTSDIKDTRNWFQKFYDYVKTGINNLLSRFTNKDLDAIKDNETFVDRFFILWDKFTQDPDVIPALSSFSIQYAVNPVQDTQTIIDTFKQADSEGILNTQYGAHEYINYNDSSRWESVTEALNKEFGFHDESSVITTNPERIPEMEPANMHSTAGTVFHGEMSLAITGERPQDYVEAKLDGAFKDHINYILNEVLAGGEVLASESIMFKQSGRRLAGTMDFVYKTKSGKVRIADWKTKITKIKYELEDGTERVFENNGWRYYDNTNFGPSQRFQNSTQAHMYKALAEERGVKIDEVGIIPIALTIRIRYNSDGELEVIYESADIVDDITALGIQANDDGKGFIKLKQTPTVVDAINQVLGTERLTLDYDAAAVKLNNKLTKVVEAMITISNVLKQTGNFAAQQSTSDTAKALQYVMPDVDVFSIIPLKILAEDLGLLTSKIRQLVKTATTSSNALARLRSLTTIKTKLAAYSELTDVYNIVEANRKTFTEGLTTEQIRSLNQSMSAIKFALDMIEDFNNQLTEYGNDAFVEYLSQHSTSFTTEYYSNLQSQFNQDWYIKHKSFHKGPEYREAYEKFLENEFDRIKEWQDYKKVLKDTNTTLTDEEYKKAREKIVNEWINKQNKIFLNKVLQVAQNDTNMWYSWTQAIQDSKDPIIGTLGKIFNGVMLEEYDSKVEVNRELDRLTKNLQKQLGKSSMSNPRHVYEFMTEVGEDGKIMFVQTPNDRMWQAYEKYAREINDKYDDTPEGRIAAEQDLADWLAENSVISEDATAKYIANIDEKMVDLLNAGLITQQEAIEIANVAIGTSTDMSRVWRLYNAGKISEMAVDAMYPVLRDAYKSVYEANDDYASDKYNAIMELEDNDARKEFYLYVYNLMRDIDQLLPTTYRLNGHLPGIAMRGGEALSNGKLIKAAQGLLPFLEDTNSQHTQQRMHSQYVGVDGKVLNKVPVFYSTPVDAEEQSWDIPYIVSQRAAKAYMYINVQSILPALEFANEALERRVIPVKAGAVTKVKNVAGRALNVTNKALSKRGIPQLPTNLVRSGSNYHHRQYETWLKSVVYQRGDTESMGYTAYTVVKFIRALTFLSVMPLNIAMNVVNYVMGSIQNLTESVRGDLFGVGDMTVANAIYAKHMLDFIGDVGRTVPRARPTAIANWFNVVPETMQFSTHYRNRLAQLGLIGIVNGLQNAGEHALQVPFVIATLRNIDVVGEDGKRIGNLYEMIKQDKDGKVYVDSSVKGAFKFFNQEYNLAATDAWRDAISRVLDQRIRRLHGNYKPHTAVLLQSNAILNLMYQFRRWMPATIEQRWGGMINGPELSEYSEQYLEGIYSHGVKRNQKSVYLATQKIINKFARDAARANRILELEQEIGAARMSDNDKLLMRQYYTSMALVGALQVLSMMLGRAYGDREKRRKKVKGLKRPRTIDPFTFMFYIIARTKQEMFFYFSPSDMFSLVNSPVPASNTITNTGDLMFRIFNPLSWNEKYTTGRQAGQNKLWYRTKRTVPIIGQIEKHISLEERLRAVQ